MHKISFAGSLRSTTLKNWERAREDRIVNFSHVLRLMTLCWTAFLLFKWKCCDFVHESIKWLAPPLISIMCTTTDSFSAVRFAGVIDLIAKNNNNKEKHVLRFLWFINNMKMSNNNNVWDHLFPAFTRQLHVTVKVIFMSVSQTVRLVETIILTLTLGDVRTKALFLCFVYLLICLLLTTA